MNKSELIDAMAADAGISKASAKKALESFLGSVSSTLQGGGSGKPPAQQPNLASLAKAASDVVNAGGGVSGSDIKNAVAKQKNLIKPTIERLV